MFQCRDSIKALSEKEVFLKLEIEKLQNNLNFAAFSNSLNSSLYSSLRSSRSDCISLVDQDSPLLNEQICNCLKELFGAGIVEVISVDRYRSIARWWHICLFIYCTIQ